MLDVSLPYRERAALALLDVAGRRGVLGTVWSPRNVKSLEGWRPTSGRGAAGAGEVPVGTRAEVLRHVGNRTRSPFISLQGLHHSKVLFDRSVARRVPPGAQALLGFPGACARSFAAAGRARRVFHAVDAHPRAHNHALLAYYDRRTARAELYPEWLCRRIERELELATDVLVPSRIVADQMTRFGVASSKIRLHPYGVERARFAPMPDASSEGGAGRRSQPRLLYVGQMSLRKGITVLLDAVRDTGLELTLVGNVFARRAIDRLPANVTTKAPMGHEALRSEYLGADAFVIPTLEDACSLVALEAASSGLPVITTDANGAAELLPADVTTIVPAGDSSALRAALERVPALDHRQRLVNASRSADAGVLDWSAYADRVLAEMLG